MGLILGIVGVVAVILLMRRAAIRFADQQRKLGRWDAKGPLVETTPPPHSLENGNMDEIREISGQWHGEVIRDRRPKRDPAEHDQES